MTKLIERYVVAALERTPEDQREDVGREIRGAVDEIVERRIDAGEPEEQAARSALDELGDPVRLAASYHDDKRYLIGPGWYPAYIDVLKRVLSVALPLIAAIVVALEIAEDNASLGNAIGAGLGSIFEVGLQVLFWVTVAFVIGERTMGSDGPPSRKRTWSVEDLPETSLGRQVGLADTLFTVVTLGLFGVLAFVFHERALGRIIDNVGDDVSSIPLLNPHLGLGWVVVFYALVSLSIVVAVDRYFVGYWTRPMFLVSVAENALWIGFAIALASSEQIVNPEFARRVDESNPDRWSAGGQVNQVAAAIVVAISLWDLWEGWQGYRRYERDRQLTRAAA